MFKSLASFQTRARVQLLAKIGRQNKHKLPWSSTLSHPLVTPCLANTYAVPAKSCIPDWFRMHIPSPVGLVSLDHKQIKEDMDFSVGQFPPLLRTQYRIVGRYICCTAHVPSDTLRTWKWFPTPERYMSFWAPKGPGSVPHPENYYSKVDKYWLNINR